MSTNREPALSFGPAAELYDSVRPSYPSEAVAWALAPLGPGRHRVADIGAGTGIMTRLLVATGNEIVAVEPDDMMRRRLRERTAQADAVEGSAESIPLPDGELDGAVAAQSYHWFDRERAHAELARVIRPGGVFAAIWNDRDESAPWVAEYSRLVGDDRGDTAPRRDELTSYGPGFGEIEVGTFRHSTRQTPDGLVRLLQSRSYYLRATPNRQRELARDVEELSRGHPDLAGREWFELPYVTSVHRAVRVTPGP